LASQHLFKRSLRQPEQLKKKNVKNINRDQLGSTLGRIHMKRQDFSQLQLRKLKAFKKMSFQKGNKRSLIPVEDNTAVETIDKGTNHNSNNNQSISPKKSTI